MVYDLDGDGNSEVIFSSSAGVHFLDGRNGVQKAFFPGGTRYSNISAANTTFVTDWDNDGRADIVSFAEVGAVATESFAFVISAANDDWLPAAKIHNQAAFQPSTSTKPVGAVRSLDLAQLSQSAPAWHGARSARNGRHVVRLCGE